MKKENHIISILVLVSVLLVGVATLIISKIVVDENNNGVNLVSVLGSKKSSDGEVRSSNLILEKEIKKEEKLVKTKKQIEEELKPKMELKVTTKKEKEVEETKESKEIKKGKDVKETTIQGTVKNAKEVEYKLVKEGSVEPKIYLGKGTVVNEKNKETKDEDEEEWSLDYDFSNVPEGNYELYADVKNDYGTYSSDRTAVKVGNNNLVNSSTNEEIKVLQKKEEEIKNDDSLTEDQKQEKLRELEQNKTKVKTEFSFRNQAEQLFIKKEKENLTNEERQKIQEIRETLKIDSDGDGLPDYEEERLGSDPFSADSDQDGYLDGDEVRNGYNPLKASSEDGTDKIVFQEPKINGEENNFYQINEVKFKKDENNQEKVLGVSISGKALPNSFITLYIYSDPIVVTVKTDEDGNWSYILDKELEDGNHEVYAAVTDNTGKITSKSPAFVFVKTAQAITPQAQIGTNLIQKQSPMEQQKNNIIIFVVIISILSLIVALISAVLLFRNYKIKVK